ncbi:zf-CCHC domain-containing protein/RVP_2 domain-containing protein [Gossypium australe]|uniref:Zf-CCHC domain-containing protein/RVP_2 domain-containing protein n=1 Tax=Gossypium australe TaxID=47621 RepID=A0A5B6UXZ4_9ROSI|nr:zf-CCHC domain-containing protein/RVP_2 domain-containing protein [Gossypium australe]
MIWAIKQATSQRGRRLGNGRSTTSGRGKNSDMNKQFEERAPARAYAIRACEEAIASDVVAGTFSLFDINVFALIDLRSTHSYVCTALVDKINFPAMSTDYTVKIYKSCPLKVRGYDFPASLMLLPFDDFDIILGMDWLSEHDVIVSCQRKQVSLKCPTGEYVCVRADGIDCTTNVISVSSAQKMIRKGYEAYLTYVLDLKVAK